MLDAKGMDGRSMIRRRAGLRLWLSAGWLGLLALAALLAPWIAPVSYTHLTLPTILRV